MNGIICHMTDHPTRIVLASASPRRRRLLSWLGLQFEVVSVETAESLDSPLSSDPPQLAIFIAEEKMASALQVVRGDALVLTFDTIVVLDGKLHGKPANETDARRMLETLSGRTHQVITGCSIRFPGHADSCSFAVVSNVQMQEMSGYRINAWIARDEFMGCAGAYNIEEQIADVTVEECYQNVAGLPLCHLYAALVGAKGKHWEGARPLMPITRCDAVLGRTCRLGPRVIGTAS